MEDIVAIIGAGPSGLAISSCLSQLGISNIILEKEDCCASLWKKRSYDRLKLHLGKEYCALPYVPHKPSCSLFMSKDYFINYLDDYAAHFDIEPRYHRLVKSASYDETKSKWMVLAKNSISGDIETYVARFLVIATGENDAPFIPRILGLSSFTGEIIHSNQYKFGKDYENKKVLVIGCGNSGMEISYDLSNFGADTSIVIRNPFHVLNKEIVYIGMFLLKYIPTGVVDRIVTLLAKLIYGNLSKYGVYRPSEGPFHLKLKTGRSPIIDVGTIDKIKSGKIKVFPEITKIEGDNVIFKNEEKRTFDAIVYATGYRSKAREWLKDYEYILNEDGLPKNSRPHHWKGEKGLYCVGLSREGLMGISRDARCVANDIYALVHGTNKKVV